MNVITKGDGEMKEIKKVMLLATIFILVLCGRVFASIVDLNYFAPVDSSGVAITSYSLASATTTQAIKTRDNTGYSSLAVDITGGSMKISYELSLDGVNWYSPATTDGTTLTSVETVVSNMSTSRWIVLTARLTNYIRLTFTPTVGTPTISVRYMYQAYLGY